MKSLTINCCGCSDVKQQKFNIVLYPTPSLLYSLKTEVISSLRELGCEAVLLLQDGLAGFGVARG